ncbi:MAG TPA: amino acid deaminase [Glaciihabitans sp.]|nr:amino acid deaminase [Glaciihabitans sp.]
MGERIEELAARAELDPAGVLTETTWLGEAIDSDALAGRFDRWGWSTVIDEHVGGAVISPALYHSLHARANLQAHWPIGNAGLLHVYGYLLSTVPTPYGLKRQRWLDGTLAGAYGLAADAFVPWVSPRSLLERVTEAVDELRISSTVREAMVGGATTSLALGRHFEQGAWALAYVVDGRLVTTFPVDSRENVLAEWDAEAPRLRWNAVEPPE